jgi:xylulokinase
MEPGRYILAHDVGTGGDKAVITDLEGRMVHASYEPYPVRYPRPGWAEQDPQALWQALARTTQRVLAEAEIGPERILGVGISGQMFNLLPVDERGRPLTPLLSWLDVRSVDQADRLLESDLPKRLYAWTGNIPTAKDIIPKILWFKEARPELWDQTAKLLDCKEYLLYRLTGRLVTDYHGASVYFLFDPYEKRWSEQACQALGIPIEWLPEPFPCTEVIGEVTQAAAQATGLATGTPVVACAGDVAVAQSGSGANAAGKAHLCVGTATWVGVSTDVFRNNPEKPFWGLSHIDPDKWILAGEMETGGGALMWFREALCQWEDQQAQASGRSTYELLSEMAESVAPGSDRLLFLPWLSGERAPVLDHHARGGFVGLSLGHEKRHMARAVMESVGYHLRWIMEEMEALGIRVPTLRAIGGGSRSPTWTQIISDITGRPLEVVEHAQQAGARGAALCVAVGLGIYPDVEAVDALIQVDHTVEPRKGEGTGVYGPLYRTYRELYQVLAPVYRQLHRMEGERE